jgi:uncharacterized protein (TIGR00730 family)
MKSICVFCGSSDAVDASYKTAAFQMGVTLAQRGIRLIYGGGRTGLMGQVADGVLSAGGEAIGVIVLSMNVPAMAHAGLTLMEVLPDMHTRKARMHDLCDGFIALPGGFGTWDELFETLTWSQIGTHQKAVGVLNVNNYYDPLISAIDRAVQEGFVFQEHRNAICLKADPGELLDEMERYQHPHAAVKRWMKEE